MNIRRWTAALGALYGAYAFLEKLGFRFYLDGDVVPEERFDYWLKNLEYMREIARLCCLWGEFKGGLEKIQALPGDAEKAKAVRATLLPVRVRMVEAARAVMGYLLATAGTTGELGTIANWEQHNFPAVIEKPGEVLHKLLGADLPAEAILGSAYEGPLRIIVPTVRTGREAGEGLKLKVIVLAANPLQEVALYWRELGRPKFQSVPLRKIARSVYAVELPPSGADIEYYVKASAREGDAFFPATAPALNQSLIVIPR